MCMYIYFHIHAYTCMCVHIHYICVCRCACRYIHIYVCIYVWIYYICIICVWIYFASTMLSFRCYLCPWQWMSLPVIIIYLLQYFHLCAIPHYNIFITLIVYIMYSLSYTYLLSHMITNFFGESWMCYSFLYLLYCLNSVCVCYATYDWIKFPEIFSLQHFC